MVPLIFVGIDGQQKTYQYQDFYVENPSKLLLHSDVMKLTNRIM